MASRVENVRALPATLPLAGGVAAEGLEDDWSASAGTTDTVDDGRATEGSGDALDAAVDGAFGAPNGIQVPIVLQLVRPTANAALQTR
ncbi:hypothetical protein D3C71_1357330 [compost metagenome]